MKESWKEEAWENFLTKFWDNRPEGTASVLYTSKDLEPILSKYTKSGQGEIRIFHYQNEKVEAVKKRGVTKIPVTRGSWRIIEKIKPIDFSEPSDGGIFISNSKMTEGMVIGITDTLNTKSNPGETTLLAIANHTGVIADFYNLKERGVLFTGGRQRAGISLNMGGDTVDMSKAQIEIDGGFEWSNFVVIAEMKSSFKQENFDINQAVIPFLKWKKLFKNKEVKAMVLFAETNIKGVEYWAYDVEVSLNPNGLEVRMVKSKKYIIEV